MQHTPPTPMRRTGWTLRRAAVAATLAVATAAGVTGCRVPFLSSTPASAGTGASIVKLVDTVDACNARMEGTGWVVAPDYVVTNAHVVSGATEGSLVVHTPAGAALQGTVVEFDPETDFAMVHVPGLGLRPLTFDTNVQPAATVTGYPEDGPETTQAVRITALAHLETNDIYGQGDVTRTVEVLRASIRPGSSGSPVLIHGRVAGMVFARDRNDPRVGYALAPSQISGDISRGVGRVQSVPASSNGNACVVE